MGRSRVRGWLDDTILLGLIWAKCELHCSSFPLFDSL